MIGGISLPAGKVSFERSSALDALRCPRCRGQFSWRGEDGRCLACAASVTAINEYLVGAMARGSPEAEQILQWTDHFAEQVGSWLLMLDRHAALDPGGLAELRRQDLVGADSRPTALGRRLIHYLLMREYQDGDEQFQFFTELARPGANAALLDVGCSMGQTLDSLAAWRPAHAFGVDVDLEAMAFGCRLAQGKRERARFIHGTAYALPFADGFFDLVICRNALTYMQHRRALTELVRVLKPGGFLYVRVENLRYDLQRLRHSPGVRDFCCRLRDFQAGLLNALVGWQPMPGTLLGGGRSFATLRRLRQVLRGLGCEVLRAEPATRCPRFLGAATQTSLLARKAHL